MVDFILSSGKVIGTLGVIMFLSISFSSYYVLRGSYSCRSSTIKIFFLGVGGVVNLETDFEVPNRYNKLFPDYPLCTLEVIFCGIRLSLKGFIFKEIQ